MIRRLMLALVMLLAVATAAQAQNTYGPRIGFSSSPDQIVFGGQLGFSDIAPKVSFDPDLELGFGDNTTTIQVSADFLYHFKIKDSAWTPYAGAGPSIAFFSFNGPGDNSDTNVGLNLVVGASVPTKTNNKFFVELKFGINDIPDFKAIAGWNFPM